MHPAADPPELAPPELAPSRDEAWRAWLLRTERQALDDLARSGAAEVVFVRHPKPSGHWEFLDPLEATARDAGFVTARVAILEDHAFDTFDGLVRSVARALKAPGMGPKHKGLVAMLDHFVAAHREAGDALSAFEAGVARHGAAGDLVALTRAYLEASRRPAREAARIDAWLSGTELARADDDAVALAALSPRTAKRALAELTRLARVLGWRGTVAVFSGADILTRLPAGRREDAYTVLRELVDNADGGRGLAAMQVVISGSKPLFEGPRGIASLRPLAMRVLTADETRGDAAPPHRPVIEVAPPVNWDHASALPAVRPVAESELKALRALIRGAQGLPPTEPVVSMSVGHEKIDRTIRELFAYATMESSVFAMLTGDYGSGKSHLLMHLSARALEEKRPVLRLSLERLDTDLGNPQRHLRRLLEHAVLPVPDGSGPLERLVAWTRSPVQLRRLVAALDEIASADRDASGAAKKALSQAKRAKSPGAALEAYLGAAELGTKTSAPNYRHDAYLRLHLWIALLQKLEGCSGPVVIVDEAENLYRGGTTRAERRTALRSLSFYCGGTLPGACVVLAMTPPALDALRAEASDLLADVAEQRTVLAWEDAAMLKHRLTALRPIAVPTLPSELQVVLAFRVRATHEAVRGKVDDPQWAAFVTSLVAQAHAPREVVRRVTDRLERLWWARV